ncbi:MAG: TrmB family transcriptional regulator [Candidatus Magasanikbacteria bacterium]|nr:TrmB family transcriptional regulator [Candidatus Magasanikbacteria bacterium]
MDIQVLKKLNFSEKNAKIYLALLRLGPSSVRSLAEFCGLNRGSTYDALKWLQEKGLVNYYKKDSKQHFVADRPEKLKALVAEQREDLDSVDKQLHRVISELQALHDKGGERPIARYYDKKELVHILEDILETCEQSEDPEYRIYSAEGLRESLYEDFSTFSDVRVAKGIRVKVIAIGRGGELRGLDERKWLDKISSTPTYIIIYPGKTAYISLDAKDEAIGVVIENDGVYETQKQIFDALWSSL